MMRVANLSQDYRDYVRSWSSFVFDGFEWLWMLPDGPGNHGRLFWPDWGASDSSKHQEFNLFVLNVRCLMFGA